VLLKGEGHKFGLPFRLQPREANKHNSRVKLVLAEYEFTEVFVGGD